MKFKPILFLLLIAISSLTIPNTREEKAKERAALALAQQKEKDDQEYRLAVLKVASALSSVALMALLKYYLQQR